MKQRNQVIFLAVLIAALGVIAFYQMNKNKKKSANAVGASNATGSAGDAAAAAGKPDETAGKDGAKAGTPPTQEELGALNAWLVPPENGVVDFPQARFGLARTAQQDDGGVEQNQPNSAPKLQGLFEVGGQMMAMIGGERYCAGQMIANSDFMLQKIGENSVTLRASDGRELVLPLVK